MGRRGGGQAHASRLLPGRDRRLRDERRLDRHGRLSRRLAMGTRRGARGRTARGRRLVGRGADGRQPALPAAGPQTEMNDALFEKLAPSQQLVIAMLRIAAEDSSARVGAWNLRDIAAHLAATARDCYEPRIHAIASGENPSLGFFTNDEDGFSGHQPQSALDEWSASRERLIAYVRTLDGDRRALTGHHL